MFHLLLRCFHLITRFSGGEFDGVKLENEQMKLILEVSPSPSSAPDVPFRHIVVPVRRVNTHPSSLKLCGKMCVLGARTAFEKISVRLEWKENCEGVEYFFATPLVVNSQKKLFKRLDFLITRWMKSLLLLHSLNSQSCLHEREKTIEKSSERRFYRAFQSFFPLQFFKHT